MSRASTRQDLLFQIITLNRNIIIRRLAHMGTHLPYGHTLRRSQSSLHTARRCIPNVPTYISNDHEHQNGTINSSLVGVIIGDWKFYNHQGLCFNSKRSIRVGLMDITCGLMISQDRNLIRRGFEPRPLRFNTSKI
ncbi:hypothetical protein H8356DRAFT_1349884 [Neocallimastix lanati (nom. inval.)]|nr:hypothetical protein H8356DRAFT_1349884 [Neocallimastix sp. JGI-2020a]